MSSDLSSDELLRSGAEHERSSASRSWKAPRERSSVEGDTKEGGWSPVNGAEQSKAIGSLPMKAGSQLSTEQSSHVRGDDWKTEIESGPERAK